MKKSLGEHLGSLEQIFARFLEFLFKIMGVGNSTKPFDLGKWDFETMVVEGFDETVEFSFPWFSGISQNRQLSLAVGKYFFYIEINVNVGSRKNITVMF